MTINWRKIGIELAITLTVIWAPPVVAADQAWPGSGPGSLFVLAGHEDDEDDEAEVRPERRDPRTRQDPRTMTQAEWQAIAQKVSMNLHLLGIQLGATPQELAILVPTFTQEYLRAFQFALLQGANKQQADILATQHIFAQIQQLAARSGAGGQGGDGCFYTRGGSMCSGSDGFLGFSFR
jgi:hypothetical protein